MFKISIENLQIKERRATRISGWIFWQRSNGYEIAIPIFFYSSVIQSGFVKCGTGSTQIYKISKQMWVVICGKNVS